MPRIVHSALKVDDLEKATEFYEKGFGFVEMETGQVRDHTSRHLTDGTIDLALIKYDSEESAEARASRLGPCIHHFAIEVDDMAKSAADLKKFGCEIIGDPGVVPIKFRAPGGTVAEIVPRRETKSPRPKPNRYTRLASGLRLPTGSITSCTTFFSSYSGKQIYRA